jgi:ubiquitin-conjugating enzyme E2 M
MLALKKKREADKKQAAEEAAANPGGKVSLLGVGGQKKKSGNGTTGKKRTPGEIRIQKGRSSQVRNERKATATRPCAVTLGIPGLGRVRRPVGQRLATRCLYDTAAILRLTNSPCCTQISYSLYITQHTRTHPACIDTVTDIAELDGGKVAEIDFPNPNDLTSFQVHVSPDSGYWKGATYRFTFSIPPHYPHSPPKVHCHTKVYHPNIDLQGKVCLNILREDWKPVLDINAVIYGLIYLFYEPNPDDPLNHEAAELFRKDVRQFERLVNRTLRGGILEGAQFEKWV